MSMIVRHALGVAATGTVASWAISPEPITNLLVRIATVRDAFQRGNQIEDSYTALKHPNLVGSLIFKSSKAPDHDSETVWQQNPTASPIFRYADGLMFVGSTLNIHDSDKNDIFRGNYVRCPSNMLITRTTDTKKCRQLQYDLLKNSAIRAAKNSEPLNPGNPYSSTLVFERTGDGIQPSGTLANMTPGAKKKIGAHDFTLCLRHPVSSEGQPVQVEAIVAGDTSRTACHDLFRETRKN